MAVERFTGSITPESKLGRKLGITETISASVDYDFGSTLEEAVEKFGADVVKSAVDKSAIIWIQSNLRPWAVKLWKGEATQEQIDAHFSSAKMGLVNRVKPSESDEEKAKKQFTRLSKDKQAALLEQFAKSLGIAL